MGDGQLFLLIFTLIYLTDSVAWFGPRGFLLVSFLGRRFRARRHRVYFAGFKSGFALLNPLPPLGQGYVAALFPFSISHTGISPFGVEQPNPGSPVLPSPKSQGWAWDEIKKISVDNKSLYVNGRVFWKFSSTYSARFWKERLQSIHGAGESDRSALVDKMVRSYLDSRRPRRRLAVFQKAVRSLRFYCIVLFLQVFILLPLVYARYHDSLELLWVCCLIWMTMWFASFMSFALHRRFFPQFKSERWQHLFLSLFLPNHTIRSCDFLGKRLFYDSHPLAVFPILSLDASVEELRGAMARDIHCPAIIALSRDIDKQVVREFREQYFLPAFEKVFPDYIDQAEQSPKLAEDDDDQHYYCPRCHTPYQQSAEGCVDCGGITLERLVRS